MIQQIREAAERNLLEAGVRLEPGRLGDDQRGDEFPPVAEASKALQDKIRAKWKDLL